MAARVASLTRMAHLGAVTKHCWVGLEAEGTECTICLEELKMDDQVRITRCQHLFPPEMHLRLASAGQPFMSHLSAHSHEKTTVSSSSVVIALRVLEPETESIMANIVANN